MFARCPDTGSCPFFVVRRVEVARKWIVDRLTLASRDIQRVRAAAASAVVPNAPQSEEQERDTSELQAKWLGFWLMQLAAKHEFYYMFLVSGNRFPGGRPGYYINLLWTTPGAIAILRVRGHAYSLFRREPLAVPWLLGW